MATAVLVYARRIALCGGDDRVGDRGVHPPPTRPRLGFATLSEVALSDFERIN
jgi:hypothetical protein